MFFAMGILPLWAICLLSISGDFPLVERALVVLFLSVLAISLLCLYPHCLESVDTAVV